MDWVVGITLLILAALIAFGLIRDRKRFTVIEQKTRAINELYAQIESISTERAVYRKRVIDLEDGIKSEFGVQVRQEVTMVKTHFTKLEWVVMLSGVDKLLRSNKSPDDVRIYLKILDKIYEFIDHLKEEPEGENAV